MGLIRFVIILGGWLFSGTAWGENQPAYFIVIWSYDGLPGASRLTPNAFGHSFATAGKFAESTVKQGLSELKATTTEVKLQSSASISWQPVSLKPKWNTKVPETGRNVPIVEEIKRARDEKRHLVVSDAYPVTKEFYEAFEKRSKQLNDQPPTFKYLCVNGPKLEALEGALNCINMVGTPDGLNEAAPTGLSHGEEASRKLIVWLHGRHAISSLAQNEITEMAREQLLKAAAPDAKVDRMKLTAPERPNTDPNSGHR